MSPWVFSSMLHRSRPICKLAVCNSGFFIASAFATTLLSATGITYAAPPVGDDTTTACRESAGKGCLGASDYFEKMRYKSDDSLRAAPTTRRPGIGLALAGGGTRASQFSIGVLKGLYESKVLDQIDYLSTVSGGGYAGYWYISHRVRDETPEAMFRDCIPHLYKNIAEQLRGAPLPVCTTKNYIKEQSCVCPSEALIDGKKVADNFTYVLVENPDTTTPFDILDPFKHQNNLRGHTDIFVPSFSYANTRADHRLAPTVLLPIALQLATASTVDLVGDVLFDWNLNSSPSRILYSDGIRRIYGMQPVDCADYLKELTQGQRLGGIESCITNRPLVDEIPNARVAPPVTFSDIRKKREADVSIPYWILNATTPVLNCPKADGEEPCVINELLRDGLYAPHKAAFEFTADYWGAGEFGYWSTDLPSQPFGAGILTLDEAVASSAAFFDPYQQSFKLGGLVNVGLQLTGFRWGYYLPNPHVPTSIRTMHRFLPFPLYFLHRWQENKDAVDIHLIDGGQSENLGAYSLIRRRVPNIIISDHATEGESGNMEDICRLGKMLSLPEFIESNGGRIWYIHFDDLVDLDQVCAKALDESEVPPDVPPSERRLRYNLHAWTLPVIGGCAVELKEAELTEIPEEHRSCDFFKSRLLKDNDQVSPLRYLNLFLIKPALNLASYIDNADSATRLPCANYSNVLNSEAEIRGFLQANSGVRDDRGALLFPNHTTIFLTLDSSPWLFGAYRELGAQAARTIRINQDHELVVDKTVPVRPMTPKASHQVAHDAWILTEALANSLDAISREVQDNPPICD